MRVRPQIIESPNYRKQKRITEKLQRQTAREDKVAEKEWRKWSDDLKPVKSKARVAQYPIHWYAGGQAA